MSAEYDAYIREHTGNVQKAAEWLETNIPELGVKIYAFYDLIHHDESKWKDDEYQAYDDYFYGKARSPEIERNFNYAWLRHIHRNPHHWQHWVLINDEPEEGEKILEMPYNYILEMICDWWSFSWQKRCLSEIFDWYDEHASHIRLAPATREIVEDILWRIRGRLGYNVLAHHGIKGQKWGVRNGPPYPLDRSDEGVLINDFRKRIIEVEQTKLIEEPNSVTQITNKHGGIDRNYYDETGRQIKQISNNNHGNPKTHNYGEHGEHAHDYIYDDSGKLTGRPIRELTDRERKENGDIL